MPKYTDLPRYVDRGLVFPQPVICKGLQLYGFVLKADVDKLRALCNAYLNDPAERTVNFEPLSPYVLLSFATMANVSSGSHAGDPPYDERGGTKEVEVGIWVPIYDSKIQKKAGQVVPQLFVPYMFVDDPWALIIGRETFGLPKEQGWVTIPRDLSKESFVLDAVAIEKFDPKAKASRAKILEVRPVEPVPGKKPAHGIAKQIQVAFQEFETLLKGDPRAIENEIATVVDFIRTIGSYEVPRTTLVVLKQFRDIVDGTKACYQAIAEAPVKITKLQSIQWLGEFTLELAAFESHPIQDDLGLELVAGRQRVIVAFFVKCDYELNNGHVIFEFSKS